MRAILTRYRFLILRWVSSIGIGFVLGVSYFTHFIGHKLLVPIDRMAILIYLTGLFAILAYLGVVRFTIPYLQSVSWPKKLMWGVSALGAATILAITIPLRAPSPLTSHQLAITVTGTKNPSAQRSEVWVQGIYRSDNVQVPVSELSLAGAWQLRGGVPMADRPATLRWQGVSEEPVTVEFVSHSWSGIARVSWDGQEQTIDLYSENSSTPRVVTLDHDAPASGNASEFIDRDSLLVGADLFSIGLLALVGGCWVALRYTCREHAGIMPVYVQRLLWLLPPLMAIPLSWPIEPLIGRLHDPRWYHYLAAWLYGTFVLMVGLLVVRRCELRSLVPAKVLGRLRWFGVLIWGQTRGAWLLALVLVGILATMMATLIMAQGRSATWTKVALNAAGGTPAPAATLRYGDGKGDVTPVIWQPYTETAVALRPFRSDQAPLKILAVDTDQGPLALDLVKADGATLGPGALTLHRPEGTLLTWQPATHALTLTLAAGTGGAELLWLDQRSRVDLSTQPVQVALRLPATYQGWALLPPREIRQLTLELDAPATAYGISQIEVQSNPPQVWRASPAPGQWLAQGCKIQPNRVDITVKATAGTPCTVKLPAVNALNTPNYGVVGALSVALLLLPLLLLWGLLALRRRLLAVAACYSVTETSVGKWLRMRASRWNLYTAPLLVFGVSLVFHLIYALVLPLEYTTDSLDYYRVAEALAASHRLISTVPSIHTPGYPMFIAAVLTIFGDTAIGIAILQHIALATLGPLAVWVLARRQPRLVAIVAGLCVGISPAISVSANELMTEALFTVCTTAAILIYIGYGHRALGILLTGMLIGAATLIRPTALLLLLVLLGWLLLTGWWYAGDAVRQWLILVGAGALLAGYLVVAAPWHIHLALARRTTDISQGLTNFTRWAAVVYQGGATADLPIDRPDRAVWAMPRAWGNDPYTFLSYPQILKNAGDDVRHPYFTAGRQQSISTNPARYYETVRLALMYNMTFQNAGDNGYRYWTELTGMLVPWESGEQQPVPPIPDKSEEGLQRKLNAMIYVSHPRTSLIRSALIATSFLVIEHWGWLTVPALLSVIALLMYPQLKQFVPAWLYWVGVVLATSALGMPVQRYVAVVEPLLYCLIAVSLYAIACLRYQYSPPTR